MSNKIGYHNPLTFNEEKDIDLKTMEKSSSSSKCFNWVSNNKMLVITMASVFIGLVGGNSLSHQINDTTYLYFYVFIICESAFLLRPLKLTADTIDLISYPGEIFMRFLKMIIIPLIFSSLITGTSTLDAKTNGKIAIRMIIYVFSTNILSVVFGICITMLIHPGTAGLGSGGNTTAMLSSSGLRDSLMDLGR